MRKFLMLAAVAGSAVAPASALATSAPRILATSSVSTKRIAHALKDYVSLGAVVRFDRALTASEQRRFGLIATRWPFRHRLDPGAVLPDRLFGGTSLGRIGATARHCYLAEVATLRAWHTAKPGIALRVAL